MNTLARADRQQMATADIDYSSIPAVIRDQVKEAAVCVTELVHEHEVQGMEIGEVFNALGDKGYSTSIVSKVLNFLNQNHVVKLVGLHRVTLAP